MSAVRAWVRSSFESLGADARTVDDLTLVASELASNVVQHATGGPIVVTVDDPPGWWELRLSGPSGPGTSPWSWAVAGPDEQAGRGLGIVRSLMDRVHLDPAGTTVQCRVGRPSH